MDKCYDIKDNEVTQFVLGNDGIVYGVTEAGTKESLASECCIRMGYEFDPNLITCYWSKPCDVEDEIKILISPEGEDGVIFQVDTDETCTLDIEFDYLFQFKCSDLLNCQTNLFQTVTNKSELEYKLSNDIASIGDNDYQIAVLESDLNLFITNTNNNIENTKSLINDLNNSIIENNKTILDYKTKKSFSKSSTTIAEYEKQISYLENLNIESEIQIQEYEKQIQVLNNIVNEQFVKYNNSIKNLKSENITLMQSVSDTTKEITKVNTTLSSFTMLNLLTNPVVKVSLEKFDVVDEPISKNITYEALNNNITVIEQTIYEITDVVTFFSGNHTTGIYFIDDNDKYCDALEEIIVDDMGDDASALNDDSFNSAWLHFKLSITDEVILEDIKNKKIKLGIKIENNPCEMSVLIDNIKFNRLCTVIEYNETVITENPSFDLVRVIDNKKSWVNSDILDSRDFDLLDRETAYNIKHHKLSINTKEVDINISSASAIESDVKDFIIDNPTILGSLSGIITSNIFEVGLTKEEFMSILYSELIDVKSRQTIRDYPLLKMLYENYLNSLDLINVQSSRFKYKDMFGFIKLIGNYWVDLVEQVIPSTTIWGSTYKFNNTIFDNNKFKYKKGTLFNCSSVGVGLPIIGEEINVGVDQEVLISTSATTTSISSRKRPPLDPEKCSGVYMVQINDGSEFIGSVKIMGINNNDNTMDSSVIILNESSSSVLQKN